MLIYPLPYTYIEGDSMANKQRSKGPHNRIYTTSIGLPAWYRALLLAIDPKSNSRAMRILVNHALQSGAAERLLGIPTAILVDPTSPGSPVNVETIATLVLGNRTPAQQVGGWTRMRNHIEVYGAPFVKPDGSLGWNDGRTPQVDPTADLQATLDAFAGWEDEHTQQPVQLTQVAPAKPVSRSTASTIAETEAMMAEIQDWCRMPPP
jgi:hypothetical protein